MNPPIYSRNSICNHWDQIFWSCRYSLNKSVKRWLQTKYIILNICKGCQEDIWVLPSRFLNTSMLVNTLQEYKLKTSRQSKNYSVTAISIQTLIFTFLSHVQHVAGISCFNWSEGTKTLRDSFLSPQVFASRRAHKGRETLELPPHLFLHTLSN